MIPAAFFVNVQFQSFRQGGKDAFPKVGTVCIKDIVCIIHKVGQYLTVMDIGACYRVTRNELALCIGLYMVLVSVMQFVAFLRPTSIGVLLAQLALLVFFCQFFNKIYYKLFSTTAFLGRPRLLGRTFLEV